MDTVPPLLSTDPVGPSAQTKVLQRLTHAAFLLFLFLALGTHSGLWRTGPFTWAPLLRLPAVLPVGGLLADQETAVQIGLLSLAPVIWVAGWGLMEAARWRERGRNGGAGGTRLWRHTTWPLAGLSALSIASLLAAPDQRLALFLPSLAAVWLVFLFVAREQPPTAPVLAGVVVLQSAVALGQVLLQRDLGLSALGELSLDPAQRGVVVLWADSQRWLRGYGLTNHPNMLGALLAVLILLLLNELPRAAGWRRRLLAAAVGVGTLGVWASASRAAWLALAAGAALWGISQWQLRRRAPARASAELGGSARGPWRRGALALAVVAGVAALAAALGPLLAARLLDLGSEIEARSLNERQRDLALALHLFRLHPLTGVGLGRYLAEARSVIPQARVVHNVPMLVAAELGLAGLALWAWLTLAPLAAAAVAWRRGRFASAAAAAPWLAVVVLGMFQSVPWITSSWRTAILMGLVMAAWSLALEKETRP
ncbi:MAG: O-antigen ligase family protein [Caldilineales bacterium]|nr:O-antigen ligase family protein [Caldilineales bacterium]